MTVATYFQMLRMQELGQEADRAEHNRRLLEAPAASPMVGRCQHPSQYASIKKLVDMLKTEYGLSNADIYEHDKISYKTEGEGAGLYDARPVGLPPWFEGRGKWGE